MRNHSAIKWLVACLLLLTLGQALWIISADAKPVLSAVVSATPIGEHSAVYEVVSDGGGATVPLVYLYFVAERPRQDDELLQSLERLTPFLVTRQSGAVKQVEGLTVVARTQAQVYSFSSRTLLREGDATLPINIELSATTPEK